MANKRPVKSKAASRASIIIMFTVITIVAIIVGSCWLIIDHYLNMINYLDPNDTSHIVPPGDQQGYGDESYNPDDSIPVINEGDVLWPDAGDIKDLEDDHLLNILIIGQDRRRDDPEQWHSDSMIVASINPETCEVSLISFLRDMYVQIPGGYQDNRINVAYASGGFKLLKETITYNFGIEIDGCFEVDFDGFEDIIEILGGVEVELTQEEADYLLEITGVWVPAGKTRLTPPVALEHARNRTLGDDFARTRRQRDILLSIFNEFKDASLGELKSIADKILPTLSTDMTKSQVLGLLTEFLPKVSKMQISSYYVPEYGCFQDVWIRGMRVLLPDLKLIREKLEVEYLPF